MATNCEISSDRPMVAYLKACMRCKIGNERQCCACACAGGGSSGGARAPVGCQIFEDPLEEDALQGAALQQGSQEGQVRVGNDC